MILSFNLIYITTWYILQLGSPLRLSLTLKNVNIKLIQNNTINGIINDIQIKEIYYW